MCRFLSGIGSGGLAGKRGLVWVGYVLTFSYWSWIFPESDPGGGGGVLGDSLALVSLSSASG